MPPVKPPSPLPLPILSPPQSPPPTSACHRTRLTARPLAAQGHSAIRALRSDPGLAAKGKKRCVSCDLTTDPGSLPGHGCRPPQGVLKDAGLSSEPPNRAAGSTTSSNLRRLKACAACLPSCRNAACARETSLRSWAATSSITARRGGCARATPSRVGDRDLLLRFAKQGAARLGWERNPGRDRPADKSAQTSPRGSVGSLSRNRGPADLLQLPPLVRTQQRTHHNRDPAAG